MRHPVVRMGIIVVLMSIALAVLYFLHRHPELLGLA